MIESIKRTSQHGIILYLLWLLFISFVAIISLAELSPVKFRIFDQQNIFIFIIEAELFFILVILPFFLPSLMNGFKESWINILATTLVLFLFSLPVMLLCQNISVVDGWNFCKAAAVVLSCTLLVSSIFVAAHVFKIQIAPYYFFAIFLIQAMGTFLWYLSLEYGLNLDFLTTLSPFRGILELSSPIVYVQILAFTILSAVLFLCTIPFAVRQAKSS